ncbi:MAG: hypothetical protein VKP62_09675 [Candidatus Sericytochromatia bacterium]|nr:hypothetical protein [Candidatus Sericytochromatia bacterium]
MPRKLTPEELASWQDLARSYHKAQMQLAKQRDDYQTLLAGTEAALSERNLTPQSATILRLQRRLLMVALENLAAFPLDSNLYEPPVATKTAQYEANDLEIKLRTIELDMHTFRALRAWVKAGLEGKQSRAPASWSAQQQVWLADPQRRSAWERFVTDVGTLEEELRQSETRLTELSNTQDGATRLTLLKALKVPHLSGLAYRVHTALKLIPEGVEALSLAKQSLFPGQAHTPTQRLESERSRSGFNSTG